MLGCSSGVAPDGEHLGALRSELSGAGFAGADAGGGTVTPQLGKYHWAPQGAGSEGYLAGVIDFVRQAPVVHNAIYLCRGTGTITNPGIWLGSGSCATFSSTGAVQWASTFDVLDADDPDAFQWVTYATAIPANAITSAAGAPPFCRVSEDGVDGNVSSGRGVDVGVLLNGKCTTGQGNSLGIGAVQILTARVPATACTDALETWPAGATTDQETCEGETLYTPPCYSNAPAAPCGISGYGTMQIPKTCASSAFGLKAWGPVQSTQLSIYNKCALDPSYCGSFWDGACSDAAHAYELALVGGTWVGTPTWSGHHTSAPPATTDVQCAIQYQTPVWNTQTNGTVCGYSTVTNYAAPTYNSCRASPNGFDYPANCSSTPSHAPRGLTESMAQHLYASKTTIVGRPAYPSPTCSTCEGASIDSTSPASYAATASAKFACLAASYNKMISQGGEDGAESAAAIARDLKLLYELHGDGLTDPTTRAFVVSLYAPPVASNGASLARCAPDSWVGQATGMNSPTLVARTPQTLDVVYQASDSSVRFRELLPGASQWAAEVNLSGGTLYKPSASGGYSPADNRLDVFSASTAGTLYENYYTPTSGGHWASLGGAMSGAASVASWGTGRLDVFYLGSDKTLRHLYYDEVNHPDWSVAESLGGNFVGDPAVVSWAANRIDMFMRSATDSSLQHMYWNGSAWAGPEKIGTAVLASNPTVASWGSGRLDTFWAAADKTLHHAAFDNGAWQAEENLGVTLTGDPAAASPEANRVDLVTIDPTTQQMVHRAYRNGTPGALNPTSCTWLDSSSDLLCGVPDAPVSVPAACRTTNGASNEVQYEQDLTELAACTALTLPHVPGASVAAEVDRCEASIGRLLTQTQTGCNGGATATLASNLLTAALTQPVPNPPTVADLQARLAHIQAWWSSMPASTRNPNQAHEFVGEIYKPLYAMTTTTTQGNVQQASLQQLATTATILINAAFTPYGTTGAGPLTTAPLGYVVADAFQPLTDRLKELGVLQDLACRYTSGGCSTTGTAITQMWTELSKLASAADLQSAIGAATLAADPHLTADPWQVAFTNMNKLHATLDAATTDAAGGTWSPVAAKQPAALAPLAALIASASQRVASYKAAGPLELGSADTLYAGLEDSKQTVLINELNGYTTSLDAALSGYTTAAGTLAANLLTDIKTGADAQSLTDKYSTLSLQFQNETANLEGLRASAAADELRFADFAKAFQATLGSGAVDPNSKITVGPSSTISVSAANAKWSKSYAGGVSGVAVTNGATAWTIPSASAPVGSLINFTISGKWGPTCAVSRSKFPDGTTPNVAGVLTGPEGFGLTYANSAYSTTSQQTNDSTSSGYSNTEADCQSFNTNEGVSLNLGIVTIGGGGSQSDTSCFNTTQSSSSTSSNISGTGSDSRTAATFAAGLRLADTPFPNAPAGALMLVQVSPDLTQLYDARILTEPGASVLVDQASTFYLVVNDDTGCAGESTQALTVQANVLQTVGSTAIALGKAMATTYAAVHAQVSALVQQGVLQPDEGALLRTAAYNTLRLDSGLEPTAFPPALTGLFDTWLEKEIVRMEREVDILNAERARQETISELTEISDEITANKAQSAIAAQLPDWEMFNFDGQVLGTQIAQAATHAAQYLYPLASLRFPSALTTLANDSVAQSALGSLRAAVWDTSIETLATAQAAFNGELAYAYQLAVNNLQPGPSRTQWAVLSIANPNAPQVIGAPALPWHQLDATRSREVWASLSAGSTLTLSLNPDDLYDVNGNAWILTCTQASPVVMAMGLYVGMPDTSFTVLNGEGISPQMFVSDAAQFATPTGIQSFRLQNEALNGAPLRTYFGLPSAAQTTVQADLANAQDQAGNSPFGQFVINTTALKNASGNPLSQATELDVVFQLDVSVGPSLTYLPACQAK